MADEPKESRTRMSSLEFKKAQMHRSPSLAADMAGVFNDAMSQRKAAQRWKKTAGIVAVAAVLLVAAMLSTVILGNEISKELGSQHDLLVGKNSDNIMGVAEAMEDLPLVVAPVLPKETLERVKTLSVTFGANYELFIRNAEPELDSMMIIPGQKHPEKFNESDMNVVPSEQDKVYGADPVGKNKTEMTIKYAIMGYALESETSLTFFCEGGDKVIIQHGAAWIERPRGHVYYVAFSSAHSAAFKAAGVNATAMEEAAFAALGRANVNPASNQLLTLASPGSRRQLSSKRRLLVDYGWCSINGGFLVGASSDSSDYCNPSQSCDSWGGCGGSLSSCCIVHDKCLQSSSGTSRCSQTNCKGYTCDKNLASCAWGVSCSYKYKCGWWKCWGYDTGCGVASTAVTGAMGGVVPQANWNTGGANTHTCCDGSC